MSVVQRCPSCGTTQAAAGECEACHEAPVRYFCTNHEPGVWLAGRTCPQCEARAALAARPIASTPAVSSRARPAVLEPDGDTARERRLPADDEARGARPERRALRADRRRDGVLARRAPPPVAAEREPASPSPERGWVLRLALRLVLIAVFLIVALAVAVYWLARSLP